MADSIVYSVVSSASPWITAGVAGTSSVIGAAIATVGTDVFRRRWQNALDKRADTIRRLDKAEEALEHVTLVKSTVRTVTSKWRLAVRKGDPAGIDAQDSATSAGNVSHLKAIISIYFPRLEPTIETFESNWHRENEDLLEIIRSGLKEDSTKTAEKLRIALDNLQSSANELAKNLEEALLVEISDIRPA
jgi:hypothetical protein